VQTLREKGKEERFLLIFYPALVLHNSHFTFLAWCRQCIFSSFATSDNAVSFGCFYFADRIFPLQDMVSQTPQQTADSVASSQHDNFCGIMVLVDICDACIVLNFI